MVILGISHSSLLDGYFPVSINPRMPDKADNIYTYCNKTCHTKGAASIGTNIMSFYEQNQVITANQHLLMALTDHSEAAQNTVHYARHP